MANQCYVFLADSTEKHEVLNVYCKVSGFSPNQAREHVADVLKKSKQSTQYNLYYVGIIDFSDADKEVITKQDDFFDKDNSVWILNCSYRSS